MSDFANVTTLAPEPAAKNTVVGLIAAGIAVLFFGSNFIPVKRYESSDGFYFQLVLCCGIWITGLVFTLVFAAMDGMFVIEKFHPWAMLGGFFWATGNIMCVPCIKFIGLSIGLLLWGTSSMIWGWAQGRFGLLGLKTEVVNNPVLNYIGIAVAVVAMCLYFFVQPNDDDQGDGDQEDQQRGLVKSASEGNFAPIAGGQPGMLAHNPMADVLTSSSQDLQSLYHKLKEPLMEGEDDQQFQKKRVKEILEAHIERQLKKSFLDKLPVKVKRILGYLMAITSGLLYGSTFIPVQSVIDNQPNSDPTNAHYIFSHFCGIFLSSIMYFILYTAFMRCKPIINPKITLPAFISGIMWAVAQSSWFIANENLSQVVSYPIVTGGPGLVAAIWGIFLFKEIKGRKNFIVLAVAFCGTIGSGVIVALSTV